MGAEGSESLFSRRSRNFVEECDSILVKSLLERVSVAAESDSASRPERLGDACGLHPQQPDGDPATGVSSPAASPSSSGGPKSPVVESAAENLRKSFCCPIGQEIMEDPVRV